jgi:hypothetical protein
VERRRNFCWMRVLSCSLGSLRGLARGFLLGFDVGVGGVIVDSGLLVCLRVLVMLGIINDYRLNRLD